MTFFQNPARLLWLIFASLLLLGLSQVLWIKRVWHEQKDVLAQETNYLFQRTVLKLQDSLVCRSTTRNGLPIAPKLPGPGDFFPKSMPPAFPHPFRSETTLKIRRELTAAPTDSNTREINQVQVFVTASDTQTVAWQRSLGRVFLKLRPDSLEGNPGNVIFEIQTDTVSEQELRRSYAAALDSARLPGAFKLLRSSEPPAIPKGVIATEPALAGLLRHQFFVATFHDYDGYLVQKILPYSLFSLFLFCLTSLAFWLIFNNLKQQHKLSQQKNEFISNVTHELKTPLTTVGVALEALHDFEVLRHPEKTREYLQISKLELDRLNLLVDKVLRLSMFEQQALQLHPENIDLADTTQQVINAMTLQAKSAGASIRFAAQFQPCWVSCDRLHLTGVVYNLLDNALKYRRETPEIDVSIEKILRDGKAFFCLKVRDNGIGIAPEFQKQVFEKFFRVPTGDAHNVKGHGLGLSYIAHVTREHGGAIRVESQPGQGSTFIVEIPAATHPPIA